MKKIILIQMFLATMLFIARAQDINEKQIVNEEKIQSLKIAYITKKLDFTSEEAQKFWPVYNKYDKELKEVLKTYKGDPEKDPLELEQKILDVRKKYKEDFVKVIGQNKATKLFKVEKEFRMRLFNAFKNRRQQSNPGMQRKNPH